MEIFISWSGELSKELGEIFRDWIPGVLQSVRPYFTPDDVEKGSRWSTEVAKELQQSQIAIIVLTRDNLLNPWIMFEAGALSKQLETSRICPILFGLKNSDLVGPLIQFQATSFAKGDMKKLVKTINNACSDNKLADNVVDSVFEMWWTELAEKVDSVMGKERARGGTELRSERDLIEEILDITRMSASRSRGESSGYIHPGAIDHLVRAHNALEQAVESKDMAKIEEVCEDLRTPIGYIVTRSGREDPGQRGRVIRESARRASQLERRIGGEEEEERNHDVSKS